MSASVLAESLLALWRDDPRQFVADLWPDENLREWQADLFEAFYDGARRVAVRAPRSAGKTRTVGWLALWWLCTRPDSLTYVVTPFARQARHGAMTEVRALWDASPTLRALFPDFEITDFEVRTPRPHWRLVATSASDPGALAGLHAGTGGALVIVDEASQLEDRFFLQLGPMLWGSDSRCFVVSTPQGRSGFFWDIFSGSGRELFDATFSVTLEQLPHMADLAKREAKHLGADSVTFRQAYKAEFADADESPLFPIELLQRARGVDPDVRESWMQGVGPPRYRYAGFDPAGLGGDDAVMCLLVGRSVRAFRVLPRLEPMRLAAEAICQARAWRVQETAVDSAGLGAGIADRMADLARGDRLRIRGYLGASKSFDDAAGSLKTALALKLRERLMEDQLGISGSLPEQDFQRLSKELAALRLVQEQRSGRVRVVDPPRSPDYADALLAALSLTDRPPAFFACSPPGV